ncbi:MAG: 3-oxoacyl-ACP reductase FabG [Myxococcales bacterium]|nr:3-oxoacyl-ACP reductase FabG [Myxococcales bacterium]
MTTPLPLFRLDGRVALVTGGSRGIGRAISETLAAAGAEVFVNYARGEAAAKETCEAIRAAGGKAEAVCFDVADTKATEAAIDAIAKQKGRLDIAVSNAGISIDQLLIRLKDDDLEKLFAVNLRGALAVARASIKPMMRARFGRIVFVSSVVGEMGNPGQTAYAATKAALLGVTKSIAKEYASRQVTVNAITPGYIETDMTAGLPEAAKKAMLEGTPLGRPGTPADVAAAVLYLASEQAGFVTGQTLRVNGGMYV